MKSLFSLDNPVVQMLARVTDLIILNALFILCSLPVITFGASLAALHKIMQDMLFDNDVHMYRRFFKAFRDNFKQATLVWLVNLLILASLAADALLVRTYFEGGLATAMNVLLTVLAVLVVGVMCYLYPMIARYTNTLKEHALNAVILAVCKLPRTLLMCVLMLSPVLVLVLSPATFVQTLIFWVLLGFSVVVFLCSSVLKPVFLELEKAQRGEGTIGIMN